MRGITVTENTERHTSCNCCSHLKEREDDKFWIVKFGMGNMSTVVRLCERHLKELKEKIENNGF